MAEPAKRILTQQRSSKADQCPVERLQRWRTAGEGPACLKIVGKDLYRLKDIEAYEEASLVRGMP